MSTVNERAIAEELRRMAAGARPAPDPHTLVAGATRRRRRRSWTLAGAALAAACTAGALVLVPLPGGRETVASLVPTLPPNSPEQLRAVRDCMPEGGPSVNTNPKWRDPAHGTAADFRVLAEARDTYGRTALVGSTKGFVLCTPSKQTPDPPVFTYWGHEAPGNLRGFPGDLAVDVYEAKYSSAEKENYFRVVAGRVSPRVERVSITWSPGERTDAKASGGFFVARRIAGTVTRKDTSGEPERYLDTPPVTVTAFDAAGEVVARERNVRFAERHVSSGQGS